MILDNLTDSDLVARYKKSRDKQIVGVLYKRYTRFVFAVCLKYLRNEDESKDAVMGVFEKLFDDLARHEVANFKSWLYSVSKNYCLHIIRDSKHKTQKESDTLVSSGTIMENQYFLDHDNENVLEERINDLERELCNLSEEQRACIELFYLKEKCYQEVAEITGYTMNQVKSYIQNGKRNLINSLVRHGKG